MRKRKRPVDWVVILLRTVYLLLTIVMMVVAIRPVWSVMGWTG